jgi:hypothetical protein
MPDIHYGANHHVHERNHAADAGKPGALKGARRGLEGDGWNRSKQLTPRQPSTLLFQDAQVRGSLLEAISDVSRGRGQHPRVYRGCVQYQAVTLEFRLSATYGI